MPILNLTPHEINVYGEDKILIRSFPSNGLARCIVTRSKIADIDGISVFATEYGDVTGLPEQRDNVLIIVSLLVRQALPDRLDLVSPGEILRDAAGQPIGCIGLTR